MVRVFGFSLTHEEASRVFYRTTLMPGCRTFAPVTNGLEPTLEFLQAWRWEILKGVPP
jgi:hypothetical protein